MTKAPFSVEWLSQSSQALKSPTEGFPHRSASAAPGSGPGSSERSEEQPTGPRAGTGGRSRDPLATAPAAGAGERARGAERPEAGLDGGGPEEHGGRAGGRRLRTAFSAEQLGTLESSFRRHRYLGAAERRRLAGSMGLSELQIKTWFQNRRMKLKRQLQELRMEPFCPPPPPYGPQGAGLPSPLSYVPRPPPAPREGSAAGGFALTALPAPPLELSSPCRAQPVGFWVAPHFLGYGNPRAFLLGV